jgi:hypothetical protein
MIKIQMVEKKTSLNALDKRIWSSDLKTTKPLYIDVPYI